MASDWEQASQPLNADGVRVVHARFGVILSKQGGALAKMLPLFNWGLGGVLGSGARQLHELDRIAGLIRSYSASIDEQVDCWSSEHS
ncbi:MAG: hypothetical protein U0930_03420 [Pirellulales bacterium]